MTELKFKFIFTPTEGHFKDKTLTFDELDFNEDTYNLLKRDLKRLQNDFYENAMETQGKG